jgi:hypothetical protein
MAYVSCHTDLHLHESSTNTGFTDEERKFTVNPGLIGFYLMLRQDLRVTLTLTSRKMSESFCFLTDFSAKARVAAT